MADDSKDIEGDEAEGKKGGKLKLIIIIVVALLLVGGGAAFFLMGGDEESEDGADDAKPAEEEVAAVPEGDPVYTPLDPKFVVNLPPGSKVKMLQVGITVLSNYPNIGEYLTANDPLIRHHLIDLLEEQDGNALMTLEGKQALQKAILDLIKAKLEEGKQSGEVKDIFFTEFVLQ